MEIRLAKTAGFCFGVDRAVKLTYGLLDEGRKVATLGPLIHNPQTVEDLERRGALVADTPADVPTGYEVVIRSHGVPRSIYDELDARGCTYHDATCPFVKKIQKIASEAEAAGAVLVVAGDASHPEVQGIKGWGDERTAVIEDMDDFLKLQLPENEKLCIVSQTTFNYNKFQELVEILRKKSYDNNVLNILNILNTICNATEERQREAKNIAGEVDTMLVVGGRHSSNTQKLFEICKKECGNTYYIQTPVDLDSEMFQCSSCVGITAGASTPKKIIEEVQEHVRIKF